MINIDRKNGIVKIKGDELTIAGELSYLMMEFYERYGEKKFDKCVKAFKSFMAEKKCTTTYHIELINGDKKPLIIESDTLEGAIKKINNLKIPEKVKKYAIENLKKDSNK
jgi:hypothetical protein